MKRVTVTIDGQQVRAEAGTSLLRAALDNAERKLRPGLFASVDLGVANRTGVLVARAQELIKEKGHDPRRLKMAAICSVCADNFVAHIESFEETLREL